jgi:hypothetical protein
MEQILNSVTFAISLAKAAQISALRETHHAVTSVQRISYSTCRTKMGLKNVMKSAQKATLKTVQASVKNVTHSAKRVSQQKISVPSVQAHSVCLKTSVCLSVHTPWCQSLVSVNLVKLRARPVPSA